MILFCTGCHIQCWFVSKEHDAFQKTNKHLQIHFYSHLKLHIWPTLYQYTNKDSFCFFVGLWPSLSYSLCKHTVISCIDAVLLKPEQRTPPSVLNGLSLIPVADRSKRGKMPERVKWFNTRIQQWKSNMCHRTVKLTWATPSKGHWVCSLGLQGWPRSRPPWSPLHHSGGISLSRSGRPNKTTETEKWWWYLNIG